MMVVVAIIGIVAAAAAPSIRDTLRLQRVRSAATELYTSLVAARSEAMIRGVNVAIKAVTPSDDLNQGWCMVYVGATLPASWDTITCSVDDPVNYEMRVYDRSEAVTYSWVSALKVVSFNRSGRLFNGASNTCINVVADDAPALGRCVTVSQSGAVRILANACAGASSCQ